MAILTLPEVVKSQDCGKTLWLNIMQFFGYCIGYCKRKVLCIRWKYQNV